MERRQQGHQQDADGHHEERGIRIAENTRILTSGSGNVAMATELAFNPTDAFGEISKRPLPLCAFAPIEWMRHHSGTLGFCEDFSPRLRFGFS